MTMISYAVYDTDTGEVVHLHVEQARLGSSKDDIIQLAGADRRRALDVVQVPLGMALADGFRASDGRMLAAHAGTGAADGGTVGDESPVQPALARRYVHQAHSEGPSKSAH